MLVRILNTLRSRIWDMVVFLFSDYSKSTVGENGDCPEVYGFYQLEWTSPERYGFPGNQIPRNWHLYKEFYFFCRHLLLLIVLWLKVIIFWRIPFFFQHKSLICYLLSKPASRWNKILCWIVRGLLRKKNCYKLDFVPLR